MNQDVKADLGKNYVCTYWRYSLKVLFDRFQNKRKRLDTKDYLLKAFSNSKFKGLIHLVEHHTAHLSSAFHVSPFSKAVVLSVDGFGDFTSTAWGIGDGSINLKIVFLTTFFGYFYQALTQFIGFNNYGDEYKVMGLAHMENKLILIICVKLLN